MARLRWWVLALAALVVLVIVPVAAAAPPPPTTFVAVLTAAEEVPLCGPATNAARGVAIFHVVDQETGTVEYKIVANNLPGTPNNAHIHLGATGVRGGVIQGLNLIPGAENGVIGEGSFTNPDLLAALQENPQAYYVNVHSDVCNPGVIRGQLGEQGP
ncbi:MAG TPA: CHRD domain-containing protein [Candidatus Thermoplasmatota archaeon]|nr:CHRD domain-containing protein [Candidatus Thermoplasmatota archaeon]